MAFKLDKQELKRRDQLFDELGEARAKLEDAVAVFNDDLNVAREKLQNQIAAYNEVVLEARGFIEDVASRLDSEFDDKSERWQESDKGQAAASLRDEWQNIAFDGIEIEYPEDIEIDGADHDGILENLPVETEE